MKKALALLFTITACGGDLVTSGYAELSATDPLRHSYDFETGTYGNTIQDGSVRVRRAHLDYGTYWDNELSVAVQGGDEATIRYLGTDDELAAEMGVEQTVGGGQGFAAVEEPDTWADDTTHVEAIDQGVYLIRIVPDGGEELVVKLMIVDLDPSRRADIQWVRLR